MKTPSTPHRNTRPSNGSLPVTPRQSPARDWHADLGRLFRPLTPNQREDIQAVFGPRRSDAAAQVLQDWPRISEVAHQHALKTHERRQFAATLLTPRTRARRDRQLGDAITAANAAISAIKTLADLWGRHVAGESQPGLSQWATGLTTALAHQRGAIEQYRSQARDWPQVAGKDGPPTSVATSLLEVLAAYGRHHRWPVSKASRGLFAKLAESIINEGNPTFAPRLTAVVASRHDYARLDAAAPRISLADKRLHLAAAHRRS